MVRVVFFHPVEGGWFFFIFRLFKFILFLLIEFHCTFSISYKILRIIFIIVAFWLGSNRPLVLLFFFMPALLLSILTPFFVPSCSVSFLFHSCCSHASVFGKTLVHQFHISYSHTEWYFIFSESATTSAQCVFERKVELLKH